MSRIRVPLHTILALLLLSCLSVGQVKAQDEISQLAIDVIEVDSSQFPSISLLTRSEDSIGNASQNLNANDFNIDEPHDDLSLTPVDSAANIVMVVDLSSTSIEEFALIRTSLSQLAEGIFQEGDNIAFVIIKDNRFTIKTAEDPLSVISSLNSTSGYAGGTYFNRSLESGVDQLMPAVNAGENAQIILVGNYVPNSQLTYSGITNRIPLHVVQAHTARSDSTSAFRNLATGQFVEFKDANSTALQPLIDAVNSNRRSYQLSYNARSPKSGLRTVNVSVSANGFIASNTFEYTTNLAVPQVEITASESNFELQRNAIIPEQEGEAITNPDGTVGYTFDKGTEKLTVTVNFQEDGTVRDIQLAELYVDNVLVQQIDPDSSQFELQWDLSEYKEGGTHPATLRVHIVDYFGTEAYSPDYNAEVFVNIPEEIAVVDPCVKNGQRLNSVGCLIAKNTTLFSILAGVLVVSVAALAIFSYVQREEIAKLRKEHGSVIGAAAEAARKSAVVIRNTAVEFGSQIRKTLIERGGKNSSNIDTVLATLSVTGGPKEITEGPGVYEIKEEEFAIGRELDAGVNLNFKVDTISARHCIIRFDPETGNYFIRDENSSNGTYVDGVEVPRGTEMSLPKDAEIQLATSSSVRLRFKAKVHEPTNSAKPRHNLRYPGFDPGRTQVEKELPETEDSDVLDREDENGFFKDSRSQRQARGQRNIYEADLFTGIEPEEDDSWSEQL